MDRANSCGWDLFALQSRAKNPDDCDEQGFRRAGELQLQIAQHKCTDKSKSA